MNMKQKDILIVLASIITIGILRLFISIPNFTPIGALALTGGYFLGKRSLAFLLPLGGLLISDIVLGLSSQSNWDYLFSSSFALVYLAFGLTIVLGMYARNKNVNATVGLIGFSVLSSVLFYLITNFGAWIYDPIYTKDINGLIQSYIAGLAFYKQDIFGNLALNMIMSGVFFTFIFSAGYQSLFNSTLKKVKA